MRIISTLLLFGVLLTGVFAQRPRTMDPEPTAKTTTTTTPTKPAPKSMKAKYEGGVFGYRKTMDGTLTFDDPNNRLLFKTTSRRRKSRSLTARSTQPSPIHKSSDRRRQPLPEMCRTLDGRLVS